MLRELRWPLKGFCDKIRTKVGKIRSDYVGRYNTVAHFFLQVQTALEKYQITNLQHKVCLKDQALAWKLHLTYFLLGRVMMTDTTQILWTHLRTQLPRIKTPEYSYCTEKSISGMSASLQETTSSWTSLCLSINILMNIHGYANADCPHALLSSQIS